MSHAVSPAAAEPVTDTVSAAHVADAVAPAAPDTLTDTVSSVAPVADLDVVTDTLSPRRTGRGAGDDNVDVR